VKVLWHECKECNRLYLKKFWNAVSTTFQVSLINSLVWR